MNEHNEVIWRLAAALISMRTRENAEYASLKEVLNYLRIFGVNEQTEVCRTFYCAMEGGLMEQGRGKAGEIVFSLTLAGNQDFERIRRERARPDMDAD